MDLEKAVESVTAWAKENTKFIMTQKDGDKFQFFTLDLHPDLVCDLKLPNGFYVIDGKECKLIYQPIKIGMEGIR